MKKDLMVVDKKPSECNDLYEVFELNKFASNDSIKRAYYKKSKRWHPDSEKGNEEEFKILNNLATHKSNIMIAAIIPTL